ncbi:MAG TPA: DUF4982 domain-containing protein, partial [Polyangia bacterium]|nr:DUF4982 domain-containing protein [Polyangia bacterium]
PIPRVNQKGLCERDLTPKEGYYVFQSYWAKTPMVRVYGHSWPVRWGAPGEAKMVKVYSNCAAVELFVNGESAGTRRRDSQDFPAAGLRWLVPFREGENELRAVARPDGDGRELSDRVTFQYQTTPWGKPARLLLEVDEINGGDVAVVHARLVDDQGVRCLDARDVVRFGLAGDGRLLDNLGTNRGARQVELRNGRAQIAVALGGGVSTVSVSAPGLPTAFVTVGARPR